MGQFMSSLRTVGSPYIITSLEDAATLIDIIYSNIPLLMTNIQMMNEKYLPYEQLLQRRKYIKTAQVFDVSNNTSSHVIQCDNKVEELTETEEYENNEIEETCEYDSDVIISSDAFLLEDICSRYGLLIDGFHPIENLQVEENV